MRETKELINITLKDYEKLSKSGLSKRAIRRKFNINSVVITYIDKSTKEFDLWHWLCFREGIIKNILNKNLGTIEFK
jgi:hypothetical protein